MKSAIAFVAATAALANAAAAPSPAQKASSSTSSGSLPAVSVKGNAFFAGDNRFYIRGVDYQPGGSSDAEDPIADVATCKRDIAEFKKLGINTVRVYTVDNTANHDECMSALADAGIYLALDVNTPKYSLRRDKPAVSYNAVYLQSVFATIDAFAGYTNTLLFFSGNEVINADDNTNCAPYIKAVTRDMKSYISSKGYRSIPVGYSAADVESNRYDMAQYMNCGTDDQRSDFYAFNDYSWCDPSSYTTSGWDQKVEQYGNYSLPIFLSEYGCITNDRKFEEVASLYDPKMTSVYSGGLVYEYAEEGSGYGLVKINGDSVKELPDFAALQTALQKTKAPTGDGGYKSSGEASQCPETSKTWEVTEYTGEDLPAMPEKAQVYLKQGAGTGPGLTGDGSQEAGDGEHATASAGSGATETGSGSSGSGTSSSAANAVQMGSVGFAPFVCTGAVLLSAVFGMALV